MTVVGIAMPMSYKRVYAKPLLFQGPKSWYLKVLLGKESESAVIKATVVHIPVLGKVPNNSVVGSCE